MLWVGLKHSLPFANLKYQMTILALIFRRPMAHYSNSCILQYFLPPASSPERPDFQLWVDIKFLKMTERCTVYATLCHLWIDLWHFRSSTWNLILWICIDCFNMNEWIQCWKSGCNVEYIDENWQDSHNAYVNTVIAYLVILTSGLVYRLLPKMQCAKWPCSGLPYDGAM